MTPRKPAAKAMPMIDQIADGYREGRWRVTFTPILPDTGGSPWRR